MQNENDCTITMMNTRERKVVSSSSPRPTRPRSRTREEKLCKNVKLKTKGRHKCEVCNKAYVGKSSLVIHKRKHTGELPFMCDVCGQCYKAKSILHHHRLFHSKIKAFKCDVCYKSFYTNFTLSRHKLLHSNVKSFICHQCGLGFMTKIYLRRHIARHNGVDHNWKRKLLSSLKPLVTCDICGRKRKNLQEHLKIHIETRNYMCIVCGHSFINEISLKKHKRKHEMPRKFGCSYPKCKWSFKEKTMLTRHERIHTKPSFPCSKCVAFFYCKDRLEKHQLLHGEKKRTFLCTLCNRPFSKGSRLENHMRVHSGEKPFKCDVCCKSFSQSYTRIRHINTVHNGIKL